MKAIRLLFRCLKVYLFRRDWLYSPLLVMFYGRHNYQADAHIYPDIIKWRQKTELLPRNIVYLSGGRTVIVTAMTEEQVRGLELRAEEFVAEWNKELLDRMRSSEEEE